MLVTYARDSGMRVDEAELDRAVANVAAQNQLTLPQLRERLRREGIDYARFRNQVRDQMLVERVREREVQARIRITDAEIDAYLDKQRGAQQARVQHRADPDHRARRRGRRTCVAERRARRRDGAGARPRRRALRERWHASCRKTATASAAAKSGCKPADRLPEVFVEQVRALKAGEVSRRRCCAARAGFHVLKLLERREGGAITVTQTRAAPHPAAPVGAVVAGRRDARGWPSSSGRSSRARGPSRHWRARTPKTAARSRAAISAGSSPGSFVPEFEEAMNALPEKGMSEPVVSRFGVHLIQVLERREVTLDPKQLREQARNILREQKFEDAYNEWIRELRARAYVEMREPPHRDA